MKFTLFKKSPKPAPLSDVERALLKSLYENPNGWQISRVADAQLSHNRELGIIVGNRGGACYSGKLNFGLVFSAQWSLAAGDLENQRLQAEAKIEAERTEANLRKVLKL